MCMERRTRRSPARFLAPLALIAVLVVFLAIINASGGSDDSSPASDTGSATTTTTSSSATTTSTATKSSTAKEQPSTKVYVVQVGDTLGGIADKTGVPLETLQELNPNVDEHAMTAGQKIKLR